MEVINTKVLQELCCLLTDHKFRHLTGWSYGITPTEFHWQCRICGKKFWNYDKPNGFKEQK
mgnify:CR=1 FL=1